MNTLVATLFTSKSRRQQYDVAIHVHGLIDIPLVQGRLFCKWKLRNALNDQRGKTQRWVMPCVSCGSAPVVYMCALIHLSTHCCDCAPVHTAHNIASLKISDHTVEWNYCTQTKATLLLGKDGQLVPCPLTLNVKKV